MSSTTWQHSHRFDSGHPPAERRTRWALLLTLGMMIAEIAGGWLSNSMALLADGWHMSSHSLALGLTLLAYIAARRYADDPRFTFGTWKIEILGGYTSALLLLGVAAVMAVESLSRLISPGPIAYDEAMGIALIGLGVNLVCAWLLHQSGHHHHHDHHDHGHDHHHHDDHHHDLNLRSAYLHVLADAATSVLAIVALACGKLWGLSWLDPLMGLVGAVMVANWSRGLLRDSGKVLLDAEANAAQKDKILKALSGTDADVTDLHLWRVGNGQYACIVSLATRAPHSPDHYKALLAANPELAHITVEVNPMDNARTAWTSAAG